VLIEVDDVASPDGPPRSLIAVRDTGIGIPDDKLEDVFQKFTQADPSTTRRYGGTGLGLAISKQLVELMGGRIGVESRRDHGSRFWFTLPAPDGEEAEAAEPPRNLTDCRLLLADDVEASRLAVAERAAAAGIEVRSCATGSEALEALRRAAGEGAPFHALVVDHRPPAVDGLALALAVRGEPAVASTVLVALAWAGRRAEVRRLAEAGFDACLSKPVHPFELSETLGRLLARRVGAARAADPAGTPRPSEATGAARGAAVLVVEDNRLNQKVATGLLEGLGCRVEVASDGREAIDLLRRRSYDLVLMDCQMPVLDGYAAASEIRRLESGARRTPVVAMTAHAMQGDRDRCLAAGMDDYLTKPLGRLALAEVLGRWVAG
jgi:CheY-like chemotaxis protein